MAHFLVEYVELGNPAAREEKRGDHIAYRKGLGGAMALAGPLLAEDGQPTGSIVILEAEDEAGAEELALADPYVAAGVLELVSVRRYRIAAMKPPG
ncbi:MAG TPA: YciI family protein [Sphingomonadaceae bacterium]